MVILARFRQLIASRRLLHIKEEDAMGLFS
jgi:hypothetical protein